MSDLQVPVELTEAELDAVAAGQGNGIGGAVGGLVAAGVGVGANVTGNDVLTNFLNNNNVTVVAANGNEVGVGAAVAALGGTALGLGFA